MSSHKNNYCGIGVMTGTSLDGVDLVCATFSDATRPLGIALSLPLPGPMRCIRQNPYHCRMLGESDY